MVHGIHCLGPGHVPRRFGHGSRCGRPWGIAHAVLPSSPQANNEPPPPPVAFCACPSVIADSPPRYSGYITVVSCSLVLVRTCMLVQTGAEANHIPLSLAHPRFLLGRFSSSDPCHCQPQLALSDLSIHRTTVHSSANNGGRRSPSSPRPCASRRRAGGRREERRALSAGVGWTTGCRDGDPESPLRRRKACSNARYSSDAR